MASSYGVQEGKGLREADAHFCAPTLAVSEHSIDRTRPWPDHPTEITTIKCDQGLVTATTALGLANSPHFSSFTTGFSR